MAKLVLDLTGQAGLAPNFAGDLNDTNAQPHIRYLGEPGQLADGIYDPLRIQGYMCPANNTYTNLTGTITDGIISAAYSPSADTAYFAEDGTKIAELTGGLNDTSLSETTLLTEDSVFKDLEIYEINDQEAVFYTYLNDTPTTSNVPNLNLGFFTTNSDRGAFQIAARVYDTLTVENTAEQTITSSTNHALAQKFSTSDFFTIGTFPVSGIRVYLNMPYIGVTQTWTLKIGIQTNNAGSPSGSYVTNASVTIDPNTLPTGGFGYVYATFSQTVNLTADTTYHIVVEPTSFAQIGANEGVYWLSSFNNNNLYTDGEAERYDGTHWTNASAFSESFDFALITNEYNYVGFTSGDLNVDSGYVTAGTAANGRAAAATNLSYTQTTVDGVNPCILLAIRVVSTTDIITTVTCGGVAMTLVGKTSESTFSPVCWNYVYTITGIATGSHTISITTSGSTTIIGMSCDYYGVDQTTPIPLLSTTNATSDHIDLVTSVPRIGSIAFAYGDTDGGGVISATSGYTLRTQNASDTRSGLFDSNTYQTTTDNFDGTLSVTGGSAHITGRHGVLQPAVSTVSQTIPAVVQEDTNTFLHAAQNGFMYWFTGSRVHKLDGGVTGGDSGTFTPDVLVFPSYIKAIDAVDQNSLVYIAIECSDFNYPDGRDFPADTIGVYSWDYQSILASIRNYYPAPGARNIRRIFLNSDGEIRLITIGENRFTEIRGLSNGKFQVLFTLGLESFPLYRDGLNYIDNMVVWLGADGITYMLGKPMSGGKEAIYKVGDLSSQAAGTLTPGVILPGNDDTSQSSDKLFMSYTDTTSGNILTNWLPHRVGTINSVAQIANVGDVYTLVAQFPTLVRINYIRPYHLPVGSVGDTVKGTLSTYFNQSTIAARADDITSTDIFKGYKYIKEGQALKSGIFAAQFKLTWQVATAMSLTADWMPRFIEIDYEPLDKLM